MIKLELVLLHLSRSFMCLPGQCYLSERITSASLFWPSFPPLPFSSVPPPSLLSRFAAFPSVALVTSLLFLCCRAGRGPSTASSIDIAVVVWHRPTNHDYHITIIKRLQQDLRQHSAAGAVQPAVPVGPQKSLRRALRARECWPHFSRIQLEGLEKGMGVYLCIMHAHIHTHNMQNYCFVLFLV